MIRVLMAIAVVLVLFGCAQRTVSKGAYLAKVRVNYGALVDLALKTEPSVAYCYGYDNEQFAAKFVPMMEEAVDSIIGEYPDIMTENEAKDFGNRVGNIAALKYAQRHVTDFIFDGLPADKVEKCKKLQKESLVLLNVKS